MLDTIRHLKQENKQLAKENKKLKKRLDMDHAWEYDKETEEFTKVPFPKGMPDKVDVQKLEIHILEIERKKSINLLIKMYKQLDKFFTTLE